MQIGEGVGGAQFFDRGVRQFDIVALGQREQQLRFQRTFDMQVQFRFRQAFDEGDQIGSEWRGSAD